MIKDQNLKQNSKTRRSARRQEKQEAWKKNNPTKVGYKFRVEPQKITTVFVRNNYTPTPLSVISVDASLKVCEFKHQIIMAAYSFEKNKENKTMSYKYVDAMHKVVNHAHQRDPRKKW